MSRLAVALVRQDSERKWAGQGGAGRRPQRDWARAGLGGQGGSRAEGRVRGGSVLPQSAGVGWAGLGWLGLLVFAADSVCVRKC